MDQGKPSCLPFDLNSEPENSYNSIENQHPNVSLPVDLNSTPESSLSSSQDQRTDSCLSFDLNSVPESSVLCVDLNSVPESSFLCVDLNSVPKSPFLFVDLNLVPESSCQSSQNQQTNSCHQAEVDNQEHSFLSKRKRPLGDVDNNDEIVAKRARADREKLRRDKLNNSFQELGNILDPDRHKNNKRIILADAIDVLKDLTSELSRLNLEHAALSEESRELIQEKDELKSEKASLKSDIENLQLQLQSLSFMPPWAPTYPSQLVAQSIPYPIPLHTRSGPIQIHSPPLQPIPFFKHQSGASSSSGSAFPPYLALVTPCTGKASTSIASSSYDPNRQNFKSQPSTDESDKVDNFGGAATELELRLASSSKKLSPRDKGKRPMEDEGSIMDESFLSMHSSSRGFQGSSSNSSGDI